MDCVINLDKPKGITSHDAVAMVRRLLKMKKVGHAGTLDPMATGVLIVCTGEATKVASLVADMDKEYEAQLMLGQRTDTYDAEGTVIAEADYSGITKDAFIAVLERFKGRIMQVPPMYSAIKQQGTPLYKLARKGIEVERAAREIEITALELLSFEPPYARLRVGCSKGTYIRTLVDDIGSALGCLSHMTALRRTRIGAFEAKDSVAPDEILIAKHSCCTIDHALIQLPQVVLDGAESARAIHGNAVRLKSGADFADGTVVRVKSADDSLMGIGRADGGWVKMQRMFNLGVKT